MYICVFSYVDTNIHTSIYTHIYVYISMYTERGRKRRKCVCVLSNPTICPLKADRTACVVNPTMHQQVDVPVIDS